MSRVCCVCGKGQMSGNSVSHSNRATRRTWGANVQKVNLTKPNGKQVKDYVCTRCLRTDKKASN